MSSLAQVIPKGAKKCKGALRFQERLANGTLFSTPSKKGHGEDPCTPSSLATTWVLGEQPEVLTEDFVGWVIVVCGFEISSFSILEFLWVWISFQDLPANNGTALAVAAETNKPDLEEKPMPKDCSPPKKLDDGWPESVEEQGLLLLVWRHHIT